MKKKYFYSHITETSSISLSLAEMDMTPQERKHLLMLVESKLHQTIIDLILSELSDEDKKAFLFSMHQNHHEKVWTMLHKKIEAIEEKITKVADQLKKEIHNDITQAKNIRG